MIPTDRADIDYAELLAPDSIVRSLRFREDHVLFRPHSPRGYTHSGLWLERNPAHPKIWGWLLAVAYETQALYPGLIPGCMLVVTRHHGEPIAKEPPVRVRYIGHHHPVIAMPVSAIQLAINPTLIAMEDARAQDR